MKLVPQVFALAVCLCQVAAHLPKTETIHIKPGQPLRCYDAILMQYYDDGASWQHDSKKPTPCASRSCTITKNTAGGSSVAQIHTKHCFFNGDIPSDAHKVVWHDGTAPFPDCCPAVMMA